ncbi:hypothetical protein [Desulfovibrio sp. ZJ200]|nr:hypothetical protein [Desulfovibrio sp. ZJ200]
MKYLPATELQRAREHGWNNQSGSHPPLHIRMMLFTPFLAISMPVSA